MIYLVNDADDQMNILECLLRASGLKYKVEKNPQDIGVPTPYIIVDGVPLDAERAIKYIKERVVG